MQNDKPKKPIGRPPIAGRRVVIKLTDEQIARASELGKRYPTAKKGNVAEGIRKALALHG